MFGFRRKKHTDGRLGRIHSFEIFYGLPSEAIMKRLAKADLAIVEPLQWTREQAVELRSAGTLLFGYLAVMESPSWHTKRIAAITESDKLHVGGKPFHFPAWDSYLMDLRSTHYQAVLADEIGSMTEQLPLDGLLLDTVGDIEEYVPAALRDETGRAYHAFLADAAARYPSLKWIQNRGFDQLERCAELLDGFLWEGWDGHSVHNEWTQVRLQLIERLRKSKLSTLSVTPDRNPLHKSAAEKYGFIHWTNVTAGEYNEGR